MASFSFGAGNAGKLLRIPLYALGRIITAVTPRTGDLWVFGSAAGPADGAWALWEYAVAQGERAVWLTASAEEAAIAQRRGIPWAPKASWRGFRLTARAAVIVVTHGFGDVNRYAATGGVIVQLWHGIPLKRIGLDAAVTTASPLPFARRATAHLLGLLYRRTQARIAVLPAASEIVRGRLESAFGLGSARVPVTGEPRTDVLWRGTADERREIAGARLREILPGVTDAARLILYAPTWRDGAADPAGPDAGEATALAAVLEEADAVLLVRAHHLAAGGLAEADLAAAGDSARGGGRVRMLGGDLVADVTPLLPGLDVLVTDYSSLAFDAASVPVATVFFAPDLAEYARSRGFYGTYEDVAGSDAVSDWAGVVATLRALLTEPGFRDERLARGRALSARVHAFRDGHSTERVYRVIRDRLAAPPPERAS
ncbi:CDP-glycerol glycerophosphotransferase family protein [Microbacterium flavum]|uniref:CDP-glycerol glycerophosphotransferase family protein n=1 Tax=Microbacterium flavum TaxID=415216 RepID=UPI0024ACD32B|nr:CDP-glycerol glycerophosphotransferase family protein [Microbacterium flavum]